MPHKAVLPLLVLLAAVVLTQCRPTLALAERPADIQISTAPALVSVLTGRGEHETAGGKAAAVEDQTFRNWRQATAK